MFRVWVGVVRREFVGNNATTLIYFLLTCTQACTEKILILPHLTCFIQWPLFSTWLNMIESLLKSLSIILIGTILIFGVQLVKWQHSQLNCLGSTQVEIQCRVRRWFFKISSLWSFSDNFPNYQMVFGRYILHWHLSYFQGKRTLSLK